MYKFILSIFLSISTLTIGAQEKIPYVKEWLEIDTLITQINQPKTALQKINNLKIIARKDNHAPTVIRCLIYQLSLQENLTEQNINHRINAWETEINNTSNLAEQAILYSLKANYLQQYYTQHYWKINQRSNTTKTAETDIQTWTTNDFQKNIFSAYDSSLIATKTLQTISWQNWSPIIIKGQRPELRPTLFDILAQKALEFYGTDHIQHTISKTAFAIHNTAALGTLEEFLKSDCAIKDSSSNQARALQLFHQLLSFHHKEDNIVALIDIDIQRINWAHNKITGAKADKQYLQALAYLINKYYHQDDIDEAIYLTANWHNEKSNNYQPLADTTYRWYAYKAKNIIEERIQKAPKSNSYAREKLNHLLNEIKTSRFSFNVESVNLPNKPFRMLVTYKNIDSIYLRVIKVNQSTNTALAQKWGLPYWKIITNLKAEKSWTQWLPKMTDLQEHKTEIKIDALKEGEYILLISNQSDFDTTKSLLASIKYHVSNISIINSAKDFFVLHRETGKPIANAAATIRYDTWSANKNKTISEKFISNSNGQFTMTKEHRGNFTVSLKWKNDSIDVNNLYISQYRYSNDDDKEDYDSKQEYEEDKATVYFFKDRAIYRPGQTVNFKGILITKNYRTGEPKLMSQIHYQKREITIFLEDVNGKTIDTFKTKINEYGSFSGKFKLPANVLTGNFSLHIEAENIQGNDFRVEEYKRPTFFVNIDTQTGDYKLNDSINITGNAKAYAGNAVDGATVKYIITRQPRWNYPVWQRYTYRPSTPTNPVQLKEGTIVTDASGKFSVGFIASIDSALEQTNNTVYDYAVEFKITDTKGETKEANKTISIGYQSIQLSIQSPEIAEADSLKSIFVYAKNQSGNDLTAKVKVEIYALQTNQRLTRNRFWEAPDQYVMNRETFLQYFPIDEYDGRESNRNFWQKTKSVLNTSIETNKTNAVKLNNANLQQGWHLIIATTIDKAGNEIREEKYLQLFDRKSNQLPSPTYNWQHIINNVGEPGESANFLQGTSANDIYLIETINKSKGNKVKRSTYSFQTIQKGKQRKKYSITESDRGGFSVHNAFIKDNRFFINSYNVAIPYTNKQLEINISSFRDKTEPGSKEKWTVTIKGKKGEETAAELLTSMYDASLDAFTPHYWQSPNIWPNHNSYNLFNQCNGFSSNGNMLNEPPNRLHLQYYNGSNNYFYNTLATTGEQIWWQSSEPRFRNTNRSMSYDQVLQGKAAGVQISDANNLNEIVAIGYGSQKKAALTGSASTVKIRGVSTVGANSKSLYVIDGKIFEGDVADIDFSNINSIDVLKTETATTLYGSRAANGVVVLTTKGAKKTTDAPIQIRKNFDETAFFFPHLYADSTGKYSFEFTIPESITEWKWQLFAHSKTLAMGYAQQKVTTQKTLMVQTNLPRFMREGDKMEIVTKISNTSNKELTGQLVLELFDTEKNSSVDGWFQNIFPVQYFTVEANQSTTARFPIQVPYIFNRPLTWRVTAKAGSFSDGEQNTLPVLSNRAFVTESLPLLMNKEGSATFELKNLVNNESESLSHENFTVEYTANPVWTVVQAIPYLMQYPYDCAEQTFNKYYANAIGATIVKKYPAIQKVFEAWKKDSIRVKTNLQKNEELKQILLQETPWVLDNENEKAQQQNIALLFSLAEMDKNTTLIIQKLKEQQLENGAFSWFKGGYEDYYITNYLVTGFGKLKHLKALTTTAETDQIIDKAIQFLDAAIIKTYQRMIENKNIGNYDYSQALQYLYMRSFYKEKELNDKTAYNYYYSQLLKDWSKLSLYQQSLIGLIALRNGETDFAKNKIWPAVIQNAVEDSTKGTYWKNNQTNYWYGNPIEFQSSMIAFASELNETVKDKTINEHIAQMKTWLLLNKQTNNWKTTIATADACYAVLLNETGLINSRRQITIKSGSQTIDSKSQDAIAGTGYFKKRIDTKYITNETGKITVTSSGGSGTNQLSYGAAYWQYFEELDKIKPAATPLSLQKKLFVERTSSAGKVLEEVNDVADLSVGDKLIVRVILQSDRSMEYLHLKDMRASGTEPVNVLSRHKWQDGLGYYEATKDASTNFFISYLPKGTYVFEYPLYITHAGTFTTGIASIQCMYAPEFTSHSSSQIIRVKE